MWQNNKFLLLTLNDKPLHCLNVETWKFFCFVFVLISDGHCVWYNECGLILSHWCLRCSVIIRNVHWDNDACTFKYLCVVFSFFLFFVQEQCCDLFVLLFFFAWLSCGLHYYYMKTYPNICSAILISKCLLLPFVRQAPHSLLQPLTPVSQLYCCCFLPVLLVSLLLFLFSLLLFFFFFSFLSCWWPMHLPTFQKPLRCISFFFLERDGHFSLCVSYM